MVGFSCSNFFFIPNEIYYFFYHYGRPFHAKKLHRITLSAYVFPLIAVIEDLHQTKARIKDILRENINRVNAMIEKAHDLYSSSFSVKSDMECIHYFIPMRKLLDVNAYICLFLCYKRCMNQLMELLMNTDGLSKALEKKFHCVMTKIDNILRYRMANKAEKIFVLPIHFHD